MKKHLKKIVSLIIAMTIIVSVCVCTSFTSHASGTGAGLAEWALNAYYEHWSYVWGGATPGAVDCSGLIYSYCGGERCNLEYVTPEIGYVSDGIPRVHGLGLHQPGHFGVYIGDGMAVDARDESSGVCYDSVYNKSWVEWFKVAACTYITNGWEKFNGEYYYYENGEYVVSTSREIGGVTYNFDSSGASDKTPEDMSAVANNSGSSGRRSSSGNSGNSGSSNSSSDSDDYDNSSEEVKPANDGVLKVGSQGDPVTRLQKRLTALGFYSDEITGYFGDATEAAYKKFQEAAGLNPDGLAGREERQLLYSDDAPTIKGESKKSDDDEQEEEEEDDGSYRLGDEGDEVVSIQERLTELYYYNEELTGYFGEITEQAVTDFQDYNDLEANGVVDSETYETLFSDDAIENPDPVEEEDEDEYFDEDEEIENDAEEEESADLIPAITEENLDVAQQVVMKSNRLTKNALSAAKNSDTVDVTADKNNSNFLFWILIVLGLAAVVTGLMLILNKKSSSYQGAHAKGRKRHDETIRYW